jgi:succinyl-CoA synthetase beta subunit
VVKAQVHAGGRGKAGGVKLAGIWSSARGRRRHARQRLVTKQTGAAGLPIERVYVESGSEIERELYLSLTLNRERGRIAVVASSAGGMDIEAVAARHTGEDLSVACIRPPACSPISAGSWVSGSGCPSRLDQFQSIADGAVPAVSGARCEPDRDQSADRHQRRRAGGARCKLDIESQRAVPPAGAGALRDVGQEDPMERRASEHDLNYVSLDGNIACMVNGAGLAMATMDLIKLHGGAAGQLPRRRRRRDQRARDRGLRADPLQSQGAAILVNIFGGIVRCDLIAEGIINAVKNVGVKVPVVVRLEGTNAEQARASAGARAAWPSSRRAI